MFLLPAGHGGEEEEEDFCSKDWKRGWLVCCHGTENVEAQEKKMGKKCSAS